MKPLPKQYDHIEAEKRWQEHWLARGTYHFQDDQPREQTFVVDTPPPTVSGLLHMGHIFSYTQADIVARFERMRGKDVFYPMGFDDNGLPTERLVEKVKDKKASAYESREAFVEVCRQVVQDAEEEFRTLFRSVALSVDWRTEYQTISDEVRALSQSSFIDLMNKGEAYRDFRPTYWDWVDQTAIAQAEIENKDLPGVMYDVEFRVQSAEFGDFPITIATTRPELLGACVAVMYHPEDANAAKYKTAKAVTPLFGVMVPMIADEAVDKEFGSGLVMCCTFGDDTDKEWQRKYELPMRPILSTQGKVIYDEAGTDKKLYQIDFASNGGKDGKNDTSHLDAHNCVSFDLTLTIFEQIIGLKPKQAHTKMVELLTAEGKILGEPKKMNHAVKCAERSGTPIEIIPTHQWFVRIVDKKDRLLARGAECEWYPEFMKLRLDQWINGLKEDWCISRQRFFGVPFPVWYSKRAGEEGKIILASLDQLPVNPLVDLPKDYTRDEVIADKDVMDTWATSSLTPFINSQTVRARHSRESGNPSAVDPGLRRDDMVPADVRPQAHEIIRTWAFYTIVKAELHAQVIPWKKLMISGWCLAADKTKMSKSKGNVVTPVALIQEKGADAVRFWASTSRLGADTAFSEDVLKIGRKLVTKLWNASNFVSLQLGGLQGAPQSAAKDIASGVITEALDKWIITRLSRAVSKATQEFERMEYCDARVAIEDFFWNDLCDNYLELVKARAYGEGYTDAQKQSALYTLYHVLDGVLRLFAPFVPHVTEELYSYLFDAKYAEMGSIHARGSWPLAAEYVVDEQAEIIGVHSVGVLNAIRKAKSEAGVSIKAPVEKVEILRALQSWISPALADIKAAGNITGDVVVDINALAGPKVTLAPKTDVA